jgi:hypothetical protein
MRGKEPSPIRVNRVGLTLSHSLPVSFEQRTSSGRPRWSVSCQQKTSVNNFGAHEERRRDRDAKRFGRLHVDDEVEAGGTLKR